MTHLQTCGLIEDEDSLRSMHDERRHYIEAYRYSMNHTDYIDFNQHLIRFYNQINDTEKAREYRTKIMIQVDHHEFFCPHFGECTYDSVGSASYEIGEYPKAALLYEKALEEEKNGMKAVRILSALIKTYSKLNEYDKMFETADRLCVQQGIRNIINSSISELIWHYRTVAVSLNLCEKFGLTEQARILFKNYTDTLLELLSWMENTEDVTIDSTCQSPSIEVVYSILEQMYDIEYYEAVITIGSRAVKVLGKNSSLEMLSNKLRFQLLVGKAKFHGHNFSISDGMKDIEDVLQIILNSEDELAGSFTNERKIACWYLIPRIVYIKSCYNITYIIRYVIAHLIFNPVYYRVGSHVFANLHNFDKQDQAQIQLSPSTELQITSIDYMNRILPLLRLWQAHTDDIKSSFLSLCNSWVLVIFESVIKLFLIFMDIHLLWVKFIFPYIVYIYFRQSYLFEVFIKEVLFWWLVVPFTIFFYAIYVVLCMLTVPKQTILSLLFSPSILRLVRDPRYKCEVYAFIDEAEFSPASMFLIVVTFFMSFICIQIHEIIKNYENISL